MKTPRRPRVEICRRRRPSRHLRQWILEAQQNACLACGGDLAAAEYDHIVPLALGGGNAPENWAALCAACHAAKTKLDLKRIAKAARQRRYHETGRSRAPRTGGPFGPARRFDKLHTRRLNGVVTVRCRCPACRPTSSPR